MEEKHLQVIQKMKDCTACDLAENRTQVVVGDYGPIQGICFVGEAPGYHEDKQGRPFVGRSGTLLDEMLDAIALGRDNVSVLNIAKCRPPENRNPTTQEQNTCGSLWLDTQLEYLDPTFIVTLGSVALGYFSKGKRITKVKGQLFSEGKYRIYPMYHPAYVLRGGSTRDTYRQDFEEMLQTYEQLQKNNHNISLQDSNDQPTQSSLDDFLS